MAEQTWTTRDFSDEFADPDPYSEGTGFADFGKAFAARTFGIGSDLGAGLRSLGEGSDEAAGMATEALGNYIQSVFGEWEDKTVDTLSPDAMRRMSLDVTSPDFWTPTTIALKSTSMAPDVIAAVVPSVMFPGAIAATIAAGASSATVASAGTVDQLYEAVDSLSDEELQAEVSFYRDLREQGVSERDARAQHMEMMRGAAPAMVFALTAATSAFGPAGIAARSLAGGTARTAAQGLRRRVGEGAAEGVASEAIQEGGQAYLTEDAQVRGEVQDEIDYAGIATQAAEGAVLGGALGGAASAPRPRGVRDPAAASPVVEAPVADTSEAIISAPVDNAVTGNDAMNAEQIYAMSAASQKTTPVPGVDANAAPVARDPATMPSNSPGYDTPVAPADTAQVRVAPVVSTPEMDTAISGAVTPEVTPLQGRSAKKARDTAQRRREKVTVVEPAAPDPAQTVALAATTEVASEPAATASPPVAVEPSVLSPEPMAQGAPTPPTPPIQDTPVSSPVEAPQSAVQAPPVVTQPEAPSAPVDPLPAPALAPSMPVQEAPLPAPRQPRILSPVGEKDLMGEQVRRNLAGVNAEIAAAEGNGPVRGGRNRTRAELDARASTNEQAMGILQRYPQGNNDAAALDLASKPATIKARNDVLGRARAMVTEAEAAGVTIPAAIRDTADKSAEYNEGVFLLSEAKRLLRKAKPTKKDFETFIARETDIRSGAASDARAERRAEGDTAMRRDQGSVEDLSSAEDVADTGNPEDAIIRAQEGEAEVTARDRPTKPVDIERDVNAVKAPERAPAVERVKRRVTSRVTSKPAEAPRVNRAQEIIGAKVGDVIRPSERIGYASNDRDYTITAIDKVGTVHVSSASGNTSISYGELIGANKQGVTFAKRTPAAPAPVAVKVTSERKIGLKGQAIIAKTRKEVADARTETERDPSRAQIEAGNYAKGKVNVQGMQIAIENPKGSTRKGVDPNGREWSVKMRADYGYINRTEGMDGDHVDVYLGPDHDALHVFVIDQIDADTRAPDEHKVMLGFANQTKALETYDSAFSDGRGMERIGDIRKMSVPEFKEWVKSNATKTEAGLTRADAAEAEYLDEVTPDDARVGAGGVLTASLKDQVTSGVTYDVATGTSAEVIASYDASEILKGLDFTGMSRGTRAMAVHTQKVLDKLVQNVKVHVVSKANMAHLSGDDLMGQDGPRGMFNEEANGEQWVIVRADQLNNPETFRHTVLHELVHAATLREAKTNAALRDDITEVRRELHAIAKRDKNMANIARYSLTDAGEFLAEANSNPQLQELLASIPASRALSERLGLDTPTLWDAVVTAVRRAFGIPKGTHTLLDAAMRVTERSMAPRAAQTDGMKLAAKLGNTVSHTSIRQALTSKVTDVLNQPDMQPIKGSEWLLGWRTFDNIARAGDRYFGENNPVRTLSYLVEGMRIAAVRTLAKSEALINGTYALQKKYERVQAPAGSRYANMWEEFSALLHDETNAGVYADRPLSEQKHLSKDAAKDAWQRAQYPDLAARYNALPSDLKQNRAKALDHFRDRQDEAAIKLIRNSIVSLFDGVTDPDAMAVRIHQKVATDDDKAILGESYNAIVAGGALSRIAGPYVPLMRRGNYVVRGRYKVAPAAQAVRQLEANEFEFDTLDKAKAFAAKTEARTTIQTVYVHKDTGETFGVTSEGNQVPLVAEDFDAVRRYRTVTQNEHVEFFDSLKEARVREAELRASPEFASVEEAQERRFEQHGPQADMLSPQMQRLANILKGKAEARGYTPQQVNDLVTSLNEMSLRMMAATRIQSRRLPRQYVAGASRDFSRNMLEYTQSMAGYNAKLDFQPKIDKAMVELNNAAFKGPNDGFANARAAIANQIMRRLAANNGMQESGMFSPAIQRVLSLSFLDKLASVSYTLVNMTQPIMITMPVMASRFGVGRAYSAMSQAYSDVGSLSVLGEGMRATVARAKDMDATLTDPVSLIQSRLKSKAERAFFDIMIERGVIDVDAGFEVGRLLQGNKGVWGKFDQGVGYLEGIARQMPKAAEAINRSVTALAAFRLEMERSGDVARAVQYGQDVVNQTQFNYSASNAPAIFNHPLMRLALQFKKHGQAMYSLMGEQIARAVRNEAPGDRAEALKSFSYMVGMHVLAAGAMGLPTEPLRMMVTAANALGVTDWTWADVETAQREAAADLFGKKMGEIMSRGITRALPDPIAIDLSSRLGLDTMLGGFGEPRSNEAQDWKAYLFDIFGGAPTGLAIDVATGLNLLASGDVMKASEKLIPLKVVADGIKSYRTLTEGKTSRAGRETMSPYGVTEAVIRTLGFTPAREAEVSERSSAFYRARQSQEEVRGELRREWLDATPASRGRLWKEIQKWNRTQPREVRLSLSDLRTYQRQMKADMEKTVEGLRARQREEHILERTDSTYNFLR